MDAVAVILLQKLPIPSKIANDVSAPVVVLASALSVHVANTGAVVVSVAPLKPVIPVLEEKADHAASWAPETTATRRSVTVNALVPEAFQLGFVEAIAAPEKAAEASALLGMPVSPPRYATIRPIATLGAIG